jgi:hypothetical protein
MRGIVIAEYGEHPPDRHAARVHRNEDHRLLLVLLGIRIGLPHEDRDPAPGIARARNPPLVPVDDVAVAVANDARADVGGVGGCDVRFGHGEAGADLSSEKRIEPLLALRLRAVANEHLHVSGVGRRTVEDLGAEPGYSSHDFAERRVLDVGQAGAVLAFRQKEIPQAGGARLRLELFDDRGRLPAIPFRNLTVKRSFVRVDVLVHESAEPRLQSGDRV